MTNKKLDMNKRIRSLATGLAGRDIRIIDNPSQPPYYSPDTNTMNIPVSSLDNNSLDKVPAWIAHEVGHTRYTPKEFVGAKDSITYRHLVNAIEDARIEDKMMDRFPGSRGDLTNTIIKMFSTPSAESNLATNIYNYTLVGMRNKLYNRRELDYAVNTLRSYLNQDVLDKLDQIFPKKIPSTFKEVEKLARRIEDLIKYEDGGDIDDDGQEQEQEQDGSGQGSGSGSSPSSGQSQPSQDEQDGDGQDTQEQDDQGTKAGQPKQAKKPRPGKDQRLDSQNKLDSSILRDYDDNNKTQAEKEHRARRYSESNDKAGQAMTKVRSGVKQENVEAYIFDQFVSHNIASKISTRLQVRARTIVSKRPTGLLDTKRISHLFTDNIGVFKSRSIYRSNDRDVILLIDASGSMQTVKHQLSGIIFSTMTGLRQVRGIKARCFIYSGSGTTCLLNETEKVTMGKCLFNADNSTPTASAINYVLLNTYNPKRVCDLILVTDGDPDDPYGFVSVCNTWRSQVRLSALGLGVSSQTEALLKQGIPNTRCFVKADDLSSLGDYLVDLLTYKF